MKRLRRWLPSHEQLAQNRWLRGLSPTFGHPRLWHWFRRGVATAVALGVFFGLLVPIAQIPLSATAAVLLRANVPAAGDAGLWSRLIGLGRPLLIGQVILATLMGIATYAIITLAWR